VKIKIFVANYKIQLARL